MFESLDLDKISHEQLFESISKLLARVDVCHEPDAFEHLAAIRDHVNRIMRDTIEHYQDSDEVD